MPSRLPAARLLAFLALMLAVILPASLAAPTRALAAPSCSVSVSSTNFGNALSPLTETVVDGTATLSLSCTGMVPYVSVTLCPNLDGGSAGSEANGTRRLSGPNGETLSFQIYQDSARTQPWGTAMLLVFGAVPTITGTPGAAGTLTVTKTVYSRTWIPSTASVGTYSSSFANQTFFGGLNLLTCAGVTIGTTVPVPTFSFSATLAPDCQISASALNFGPVGVLSAAVNAQSAIDVTCAKGSAYSIQLGDGDQPSAAGARRMKKGAEYVGYDLYQNSGRTTAWSSTGSARGGTGTGAVQTTTVYGRVPAQSTPSPGIYADNVVAQITY